MLHTRKKTKLSGMTLIEVIVAMTVIILVTIIAYIGVSASANFVQHGTDLRNSDGQAVGRLESGLAVYKSNGASVTTVVPYSVEIKEGVSVNTVTGSAEAGIVTGCDEDVEYKLYVPYFTTVPENNTP